MQILGSLQPWLKRMVKGSAVSTIVVLSALPLACFTVHAQSLHIRIVVTDLQSQPIPYALIALDAGLTKVADDSGRLVLISDSRDSVRLHVRRIGFIPFLGWVRRSEGRPDYRVSLQPLIVTLDTVAITVRQNTPLARTGFYDRVQRVQRGAYAARMITPEELEQRQPLRVTQMFGGESLVKLIPYSGARVIVGGRGPDCAMTILLDGMRVHGTLEELVGYRGRRPDPRTLMSIDELVSASSVAAIEIYGSSVHAPAELLQLAGLASCGIIAIWTGSRR